MTRKNDISMGKHYFVNLYDCPFELLNNELFVRSVISEAAIACKATLLTTTSKSFHPQGVTALGLLSESHISIHTWPENGCAMVDLCTCGLSRPELGCYKIIEMLKAGDHKIGKIER